MRGRRVRVLTTDGEVIVDDIEPPLEVGGEEQDVWGEENVGVRWGGGVRRSMILRCSEVANRIVSS